VIFITHNPHHAYPVGDRFMLLKRGRSLGDFAKSEITREELTALMAGGAELEALSHELEGSGGAAAEAAQEIEAEVKGLNVQAAEEHLGQPTTERDTATAAAQAQEKA